jgi:hypothetical protein
MGLGRLFRRRPRSFSTPAEGDRMILDMLRLQGADLSLPREVLHYSYFADEATANAAADAIRGAGYEVRVEPSSAGDGTWLALATGERVVDETTVDGVRARFDQVAGEHGGEYDGWEAAAS